MQIRNLTLNFAELNLGDFQPLPEGMPSDAIFPRTSPGVGPGITPGVDEIEFDDPPDQVVAILTGFKVWFQKPDDRPFGNLEVRVGQPEKVGNSDTRFKVPVTFGLRDWSGDWDDEHGAEVSLTVIGD